MSGLLSPTFCGLLLTQFLTATNDNVFRWLVIGIGKDYVHKNNVGYVLMLGTASFVLPYILLASLAGYLADRFPKRNVIVACKVAEIALMGLAVIAIVAGQLTLLFAVLALLGAQSALFSPAKMGTIPESLQPERISLANGLFGMATVAATVIGMVLGSTLKDCTGFRGQTDWWISAATLLGVAVVGTGSSLLIHGRAAGNASLGFPWNPFRQTIGDLVELFRNKPLFRVALGMVFFWSLGALAQLNIDQFASEGGATNESAKSPMLAALVVGLGVGSVLAGIWSQGRIELGILPLGAAGVALSSALLFFVQGTIIQPASSLTFGYLVACGLLFTLGTSAGLFSVPLESFMQHCSPPATRGSLLAAANFMIFGGMLMSSVLFAGLRTPLLTGSPLFSARAIFLMAGLATIPVMAYIIWLLPQVTVRFVVWMLSRTVYRVTVFDRDNLPGQGGALLVSNHVSWLDGFLLTLLSTRPVRMIAWAGNFENRWLQGFARRGGMILIGSRPKAIVAALKEAREALMRGELVCIFPEGGITRSGQLQTFKPGLLKILEGTQAPVIPVYLDGLWGSIFSFERGKFFWKWPKRLPYPIYIHVGRAIPTPDTAYAVRRAVQDLGARAVQHRTLRKVQLGREFIAMCKRRLWRSKVADSMGTDLTGGKLLTSSLVLRRILRRELLEDEEKFVGVLLPPSVGGVLGNTALLLDRRVAVNLNYTVTSEVINLCIKEAGIRRVLTSRKFMEKMGFKLNAELVYLEDLRPKATRWDKIVSALAAYVVPTAVISARLRLHEVKPDDLATLIFTSGSTGVPKGVMLTFANIAHNVEAIEQVIQLGPRDVLLGILPFFHSFGFTVTLWTVLSIDVKGAYHFSPLDAKQIAKLSREHGCTLILATPTFLRTYLRRCEKEDFATVDAVVVGAEKLPKDLSDAFEAKFGFRPTEGYGTTELSPLVSVNIPPSRSRSPDQPERREGTVGRPVPAVSAKITHLETGEDLPAGQPGMLWISGPNVMRGYLNHPEQTAKVIRDGWYQTGDVAFIDEDGFITITGRESRFSKIGGEMVPHIQIEEALADAIGRNDEIGLQAIVTAVPDPKKGERLVVIHTRLDQKPADLCRALSERGLPNLFIPSPDSYFEVEQLPMLGSGKLDLKGVRELAKERCGGPRRSPDPSTAAITPSTSTENEHAV